MTPRAEHIAADARAEALIRAAYHHAQHRLVPVIAAVRDHLQSLRRDGAYPVHALALTRTALAMAVVREMTIFASHARPLIHAAQVAATARGVLAATHKIKHALPIHRHATIITPHPPAVPVAGRYAQWPLLAAQKTTAALATGILLNHDPGVVALAMQAAMDIAVIRAIVTARTQAMNAYRAGMGAVWGANPGLVIGWTWVAHAGCCAACADQDGSTHPSFEDMDSHPNCRCEEEPLIAPAMVA